MNPATEFPKLLDLALAEIQDGTRALAGKYGLAGFAGFEIDERTARLTFVDGARRLGVPIQLLGWHRPDAPAWQWAWSDSTLPANLTRGAAEARGWGEANQIPALTQAEFGADEPACWKLAAFAARLSGWPAVYRCPVGERFLFVAFGDPAA